MARWALDSEGKTNVIEMRYAYDAQTSKVSENVSWNGKRKMEGKSEDRGGLIKMLSQINMVMQRKWKIKRQTPKNIDNEILPITFKFKNAGIYQNFIQFIIQWTKNYWE